MANKNYYDILGVKKDAKADDIKKSYRRLARKFHPDVNPNDKSTEDKFKEVQEAYDILSDEKKRKVFDRFGYYNDNLDPDSPFGTGAGAGGAGAGFDFSGFTWDTRNRDRPRVRADSAIFSRTCSAGATAPSANPNRRNRFRRKIATSKFRLR